MGDVNVQKQDLANILKLSAQNEVSNPEIARKVLRYVKSNNMMTSTYGKAYIQRLAQITTGTKPQTCTCLFCKKNKAVDGILCDECMTKYSGGKLIIKRPSVSRSTGGRSASTTNAASAAAGTVQKFANKIDTLAGGEGNAELRVRDLFKDVFKHHTSEEAEKIFICGTETTTPVMKDIKAEWPAPWLYSRVALWLLLAFLILEFSWSFTRNLNLIPGMIFVGACIVPFSVMIFFFETNVPQNISIFRTVLVFFVGGCASLLSTLILFEIVPDGVQSFFGAIMIGIIEEVGKMLIVAFFINKMRDCVYILNGMLIGSAVGAGFAAFESAGYAFRIFFYTADYDLMVSNINMRALLSPGGHVAWAAVTGAAIMIAMEGKRFKWEVLKSPKFLKLFVIPIILHSIWDMPIGTKPVLVGLIVVIWIVLLVLLHNGLKEAGNMTV